MGHAEIGAIIDVNHVTGHARVKQRMFVKAHSDIKTMHNCTPVTKKTTVTISSAASYSLTIFTQ